MFLSIIERNYCKIVDNYRREDRSDDHINQMSQTGGNGTIIFMDLVTVSMMSRGKIEKNCNKILKFCTNLNYINTKTSLKHCDAHSQPPHVRIPSQSLRMNNEKHQTHLAGLWYSQRKSKRASGTGTRFSFGSMVQKGKFSAGAADLVRTLKKVDFPTWSWN